MKIRPKAVLVILFLSCMALPAWSAVYYVAKTGSDSNNGSEASPWLTIGKAAGTMVAGDIVYVKAGVYNERITLPRSGSASDGYITFQNYGTDVPVVDGSGAGSGHLFSGTNVGYIKIIGFEIRNSSGGSGIYLQGTYPSSGYIELRKNIIHNLVMELNRLNVYEKEGFMSLCFNNVRVCKYNPDVKDVGELSVIRPNAPGKTKYLSV